MLFYWDMLAVYVSAEWADKLLTDIVMLWLSLGVAAWLKEYKEAKEILTRKKKELRTHEKRQYWLTHA